MNRALWTVAGAAVLALAAVGCGGGDKEEAAARATPEPIRLVTVLPSATPGPTDTPTPALAASASTTSTTGAALRGDQPVVQFARIEVTRWEPQLLEQIVPNFSMQADGFIYFHEETGPSADGWYQAVVTPSLALAFADRLATEMGVPELAKSMPITPVFGTKPDGTPEDASAVGVIYVKTPTKEGRLVIRQEDLDNPSGREAVRVGKLAALLRAVQVWRQSPSREFQPFEAEALSTLLGWWHFIGPIPFTPVAATVFGTKASPGVPAKLGQNELLEWPYLEGVDNTPPLSGSISAEFAFAPTKIVITDTAMVAALVRERRRLAPGAYWGPLWVDPAERQTLNPDRTLSERHRFLVGVRPELPVGNLVRFNYLFHPFLSSAAQR